MSLIDFNHFWYNNCQHGRTLQVFKLAIVQGLIFEFFYPWPWIFNHNNRHFILTSDLKIRKAWDLQLLFKVSLDSRISPSFSLYSYSDAPKDAIYITYSSAEFIYIFLDNDKGWYECESGHN